MRYVLLEINRIILREKIFRIAALSKEMKEVAIPGSTDLSFPEIGNFQLIRQSGKLCCFTILRSYRKIRLNN